MNVVTDAYLSDYRRRLKSVYQRFLLIGIQIVDRETIECRILGSSNRMYTLELIKSDIGDHPKVYTKCDCPDCSIRKVTCKHMYWFGTKQLGVSDPNLWTVEMIDSFVINNTRFPVEFAVGRNDTCPICFEQIDYQHDYTICCTTVCQNSVHSMCWKRYHFVSFSDKCVVCRSKSMPTIF